MQIEKTTPPKVGQPWPAQGGVYVGTRVIDGAVVHIIAAPGVEHDIVGVQFAQVEAVIPAELNGHSDWRAPDQEDLMLAWANARDCFVQKGADSIYWSRSHHHGWPWAVAYAGGSVLNASRYDEFRVRPFRHVPVTNTPGATSA